MTKDEALKLAQEALTNAYWPTEADLIPAHNIKECAVAITAIKEALAQPEPEYVAFMDVPQRTWVGLTDEEIYDMYNEPRSDAEMIAFARAIKAKLKEKNT